MTVEPSWRQLSAIPESVLKASVLKAVGVTPTAAGVVLSLVVQQDLLFKGH